MSQPSAQTVNPFPGLRPFRDDEHHLFFGREGQTAALLQLLRKQRFLAVVGTSGSGKSSLVRAGLIAELHGGTMTQAGSRWEVVILRPGGSPIHNLVRALVDADLYDADDPNALPRLRATLGRSRYGLVEAAKQSDVIEPGSNLLIVVDQFEELFRFRQQGTGSEEEAAAFVNLLLTASEQEECPIYVTITMRSDYLGDCSEIPGLAEAVNEGEFLIPRLLRDQKRDAIEKPIGVGGAKISPLLVQRLLNDVGDDPDQLPVLQHALMRMWDVWSAGGQRDRPIDFLEFEAIGGLNAALSHHADEIFDGLPSDAHRRTCERILKTLTEKGADNRGIRRPTRLQQLEAIVQADRATVTHVLDAFRSPGVTFIMPGMDRELDDHIVLDLSHESLMRGWQRLRGWVEEEAQSARIFRRLLDTSRLWSLGQAGLFRDPDLQIALSWREKQQPNSAWAAQYGGDFESATDFLDKSSDEAATEERAREAARQRELEQANKLAEAERQRAEVQQRAARRLRGVVTGLAVVAAIAVIASVVAYRARLEADDQAQTAQREAERADREAESAKWEATRADTEAALARTQAEVAQEARSEARRSLYFANINIADRLLKTPDTQPARLQELLGAWRPVGDEPDLRGWEWYYLDSQKENARWTLTGHSGRVMSVAYSPDGKYLASGAQGGEIMLWDAATGRELATLTGHTGIVFGLSWTPDSRTLASASFDTTVRIWDVQAAESIWQIEPNAGLCFDVAWNQDRQLGIASMNGGVIIVSETGKTIRTLREHVRYSWKVAWSPDGNRLASADLGTIHIWDAATGEESHPDSLRNEYWIEAVQWSPTGRWIAIGGDDRTVTILDGETYEVRHTLPSHIDEGRQTLPGHTDRVQCLAWSEDELQLASGGDDATVRVWDVEKEQELKTFRNYGGRVTWIDYSPQRRDLAIGCYDAAVRVWEDPFGENDVQERQFAQLRHVGGVEEVAWSPNGDRLASVGRDRVLRIWDQSGNPISEIELAADRGRIRGVCWNPDGTRLATAGPGDQVRIWDAAAGGLRVTMQQPNDSDDREESVQSVAWSPDGRRLAAAGAAIMIWQADSGNLVRGWVGHVPRDETGRNVPFCTVAWSPDGRRLASTGPGGEGKVWDASNGMQLEVQLQLQLGAVACVSWSPQGKYLATGGGSRGRTSVEGERSGSIRVWETSSWKLIHEFTGHSAPVWSMAWSPEETRLASASRDNTVKLWDVDSGQEMLTLDDFQTQLETIAWDRDGLRIAAAGENGVISILDASPSYRQERSPVLLAPLTRRIQSGAALGDDYQLRGEIFARLGRWNDAADDFEHAAELYGTAAPEWFETADWVVGPYPGGLQSTAPPESDPTPFAPAAADGAEEVSSKAPRWQVAEMPFKSGVNLGRYLSNNDGNNEAGAIAAYACTRFYAPVEQEVALQLGSSDDMRLWLNGRLIHEYSDGARRPRRNEDLVPVRLQHGWNTVLAKVVHTRGAHALFLRIADDPLVIAQAYDRTGRSDGALNLWSRLIEEHPDNPRFRLARARAYFDAHRVEEAIADFASATQINPENAIDLVLQLVHSNSQAGNFAGSLDLLDVALRSDPENLELLRQRIALLGATQQWAAAAEGLSKTVESVPDDYMAFQQLCAALIESGDLDRYRRYRKSLINRAQEIVDPRDARMVAKACLLVPLEDADPDELDSLAKLTERGGRQTTNRNLYWYQLGEAMFAYRQDDFPAAAEWAGKCLANTIEDTAIVPAHCFQAMALQKGGDPKGAQESLEKARSVIADQFPSLNTQEHLRRWFDILIAQIAFTEAEKLILGSE